MGERAVHFARAEHPIPLVSGAALSTDWSTPEYSRLCKELQAVQPTLLGVDQWSCYWEWVWQPMGATRYMHNPEMWGFVQFERGKPTVGAQACLNPQWPVLLLLSQIYHGMVNYVITGGEAEAGYPTDVATLLTGKYCTFANSCNSTVLEYALQTPSVFTISLAVKNQAKTCVDYVAGKPVGGGCFLATVQFKNPSTGVVYGGSVREDRFMETDQVAYPKEHKANTDECL